MTIFMVETLVVKPEKEAEFTAWLKKYAAYMEKHPQLFKEVKSHKMFAQVLGGNLGGYVEMLEFENLAEFEKWLNRLMQNKEFMTTIESEAVAFMVPATRSLSMWNPVM